MTDTTNDRLFTAAIVVLWGICAGVIVHAAIVIWRALMGDGV